MKPRAGRVGLGIRSGSLHLDKLSLGGRLGNREPLSFQSLDVDATENQGEVIQAAREACREHLRAGRDFALNGTNTVRQTRKRLFSTFRT